MGADGHAPSRRKHVRVSRDGAGREIAAVGLGYDRSWATARCCALCGRVDLDVMAATATRKSECMNSVSCAKRANL